MKKISKGFKLFLVSMLISFTIFYIVLPNGIFLETKFFDSVLVVKQDYAEFTFVSKNYTIEYVIQ